MQISHFSAQNGVLAQKAIFHMFCTQLQKLSNFEPTLDYIMLRNFRTVRPIFPKIAPKVAQNLKEKSHESSCRAKKFLRNYRAKRRGGGGIRPPTALLGLRAMVNIDTSGTINVVIFAVPMVRFSQT